MGTALGTEQRVLCLPSPNVGSLPGDVLGTSLDVFGHHYPLQCEASGPLYPIRCHSALAVLSGWWYYRNYTRRQPMGYD